MVCGNELRGMFDDRKMVTRVEQREVENKIQELNYKITVTMGSDLKSEVEKLRWVTTRRGLIAIGVLAGTFTSSFEKLLFQEGTEALHEPPTQPSSSPSSSSRKITTNELHSMSRHSMTTDWRMAETGMG